MILITRQLRLAMKSPVSFFFVFYPTYVSSGLAVLVGYHKRCMSLRSPKSFSLMSYMLETTKAIMPGCKASVLTYCHWWSPPVILHCAVVWPHNATLTHWSVNGEHCLVGTYNSIHNSLGLLVCSIQSYHNSILPPGNIGSRSTSGSAGEGVW